MRLKSRSLDRLQIRIMPQIVDFQEIQDHPLLEVLIKDKEIQKQEIGKNKMHK